MKALKKSMHKIMERLVRNGYLNNIEEFEEYYVYIVSNLSPSEIREYAEHNYHFNDVDDWIRLKEIKSRSISYKSAMKISGKLYEKDKDIMELPYNTYNGIIYGIEHNPENMWDSITEGGL